MSTTIEINLTFECSQCGNELEVTSDGNDTISIDPCEECLEAKYEEGYDEGTEDGFTEGYEEGKEEEEDQ